MRGPASRLAVAFSPLLATILLVFLTMEGHLNFGGGETDVFLSVPLLLWSVVFLFSSPIAWWRGLPPGRAAAASAVVATGLVALLWVCALAYLLLRPAAA
jgi:hypothetical protein